MTDQHPLPLELHRLEQDLADRPRPDPPAELRGRVIGRVQAELRRNGAPDGWTFAAAVATAALLWLNLSLSATLATDYGPPPGNPRAPADQLAEQVQQLLPELPEGEALRQAILLRAGWGLSGYPTLTTAPTASHRLGDLEDLLPQGE